MAYPLSGYTRVGMVIVAALVDAMQSFDQLAITFSSSLPLDELLSDSDLQDVHEARLPSRLQRHHLGTTGKSSGISSFLFQCYLNLSMPNFLFQCH